MHTSGCSVIPSELHETAAALCIWLLGMAWCLCHTVQTLLPKRCRTHVCTPWCKLLLSAPATPGAERCQESSGDSEDDGEESDDDRDDRCKRQARKAAAPHASGRGRAGHAAARGRSAALGPAGRPVQAAASRQVNVCVLPKALEEQLPAPEDAVEVRQYTSLRYSTTVQHPVLHFTRQG